MSKGRTMQVGSPVHSCQSGDSQRSVRVPRAVSDPGTADPLEHSSSRGNFRRCVRRQSHDRRTAGARGPRGQSPGPADFGVPGSRSRAGDRPGTPRSPREFWCTWRAFRTTGPDTAKSARLSAGKLSDVRRTAGCRTRDAQGRGSGGTAVGRHSPAEVPPVAVARRTRIPDAPEGGTKNGRVMAPRASGQLSRDAAPGHDVCQVRPPLWNPSFDFGLDPLVTNSVVAIGSEHST